jgi:hypothetical protein
MIAQLHMQERWQWMLCRTLAMAILEQRCHWHLLPTIFFSDI